MEAEEFDWAGHRGSLTNYLDTEAIPYHCSLCGNEDPYRIGKLQGVDKSPQDCPECVESVEYMDSLISEYGSDIV